MLRASILLTSLAISGVAVSQEEAPAPKAAKVSNLEDAYQKELIFLRKELSLLQKKKNRARISSNFQSWKTESRDC